MSSFKRNISKYYKYSLFALFLALVVFAIETWLPNIGLLFSFSLDPSVSFFEKILLPLNLLRSIGTNFTILSAFSAVMIAILTGINISLIMYYIHQKRDRFSQTGMTTSVIGIISGIFGIGCAACGTLFITPLLTVVGGAGILAFLPFGGAEFGLVGIVFLLWATHSLIKQIRKPAVCEVKIK